MKVMISSFQKRELCPVYEKPPNRTEISCFWIKPWMPSGHHKGAAYLLLLEILGDAKKPTLFRPPHNPSIWPSGKQILALWMRVCSRYRLCSASSINRYGGPGQGMQLQGGVWFWKKSVVRSCAARGCVKKETEGTSHTRIDGPNTHKHAYTCAQTHRKWFGL